MYVTLKNGAQADSNEAFVLAALLKGALADEFELVQDAVAKAKDPRHAVQPATVSRLRELFTDSSGEMSQSVRDIVLSAAQGEGADMTIGDPISEQDSPDDPMERMLANLLKMDL